MCVAYDVDGVRYDEIPMSQSDFHHATPVYEYFDGWTEDISSARSMADLPKNAQAYVEALEQISGAGSAPSASVRTASRPSSGTTSWAESPMSSVQVREAALADLPPAVLYALLRLRVDVFVVEQECAYPELDGRDLEPTCVHVWADVDGTVAATLRVLRDADGRGRIGRVATAGSSAGPGWPRG